jgi:hypothetical protein
MSIHDEQKIERLHASVEELRETLKSSEQKLKEAMRLLREASCSKLDVLSCKIWNQKRFNLEDRYYNNRD